MIKTLRITGVIVVLLAMAIFSLPVIYGVKTDSNAENYLNGPELIDIFNTTSGNRPAPPTNQDHPLVSQAKIFANILNPPKPVVPPKPKPPSQNIGIPNIQTQTRVTPKFELICTSYFEDKPELSMALIQEPGKKERTWVMQSSTVNHLTIELVKDGVVVVRNGEETFELKTPEKNFSNPIPSVPSSRGRTSPSPRTTPSDRTNTTNIDTTPAIRPPRQPASKTSKTITSDIENEEERMQQVEELFARMKMISESTGDSGDPEADMEQKAILMQKLITDFKKSNMNMSDEESQRLIELGEYLDDVQEVDTEN